MIGGRCANGKCACANGRYPSRDLSLCVARRLGDNCSRDLDCYPIVKNSICKTKTCFCRSGYFASYEKTTCVIRKIGSNCVISDDCAAVMSNSLCSKNMCICEKNFFVSQNRDSCLSRPQTSNDDSVQFAVQVTLIAVICVLSVTLILSLIYFSTLSQSICK